MSGSQYAKWLIDFGAVLIFVSILGFINVSAINGRIEMGIPLSALDRATLPVAIVCIFTGLLLVASGIYLYFFWKENKIP
ncbi:MAG: hypothetical protein K940chlam5_01344 [Candidatus Anoxychlamydiales bacterium]|uniref:DUF5671 domain-containing protein n=1 Tax=marine sediment metagenome TaxID=412755 RepID=A0A0F9G8K4_9ZZZZ|nr:hypothetical protein [Candidatus Anoxychlamydiales bacterium]